MSKYVLRIAAAVTAVVALVGAAVTEQDVLVLLALAALLVLASTFSLAARVAVPLQNYVGSQVEIRVWGVPLSASGSGLTLTSVNALAAGLHLYVNVGESNAGEHLKIAQPKGITVDADGITIEYARYVQWRERRLPRANGTLAVEVRQISDQLS